MIVTCKGRRWCIERTLPALLNQSGYERYRVIIVDYGDPDDVFGWCERLRHPRLTAIRVLDGTDFFNLSRARNCGANVAAGKILCFVDADSVLHPLFLRNATEPIRQGKAVLLKRSGRDRDLTTAGVCVVRADIFHGVRGYDEAFLGWGPEDSDFYTRVSRLGGVLQFPRRLLPCSLPHDDDARTRFYPDRDKATSCSKYAPLAQRPDRLVNPQGYGRAHVVVTGDGHRPERASFDIPRV